MSLHRRALTATAAVTVAVLALHIIWPQPGQEAYWPWALGTMAFPVAAALILHKRPGNGVGRALGVVALAALVIFATWLYVGSTPAAPSSAWAETLHAVAVMPQLGGMVALLYLFPTGRPVGRVDRFALIVFAWLMAAGAVLWLLSPGPLPLTERANPAGVLPSWTRSVADASLDLLVPFGLLGIGSLVVRWRRARAIERVQLRWFVAAAVASAVTLAMLDLVDGSDAPGLLGIGFGVLVAAAVFWSLPAAIVIAVTRYRLYDIDRLISRTVTYAVVVAVLVGVYAGGVLLIGFLLARTSDVAVAASTLAVAALFTPLRRRVQTLVDRRFNRARYDAAGVVADFSARLRDEIDLDELIADLRGVVTTCVQPAIATVWIVDDDR